jgi:hypothetical protein
MLPPIAFERLWGNCWSTGGGDALTEADIKAAFRYDLKEMTGRERDWLFVAGVDLGLKRDGSSVVVLAVPENGKRAGQIRLAHHKLWRPVGGKKIDLLEIEKYIRQLDNRFGLEYVAFDPWQAEHMAQRLETISDHRRRNSRKRISNQPWLREITPTAGNLREIASLTIESFTDRRLQLYDCEPLRRDLLKLRAEEKSYGVRLTSPRDNEGHGDSFSAFANALLVAHELAGKRIRTLTAYCDDAGGSSEDFQASWEQRQEDYRRAMDTLAAMPDGPEEIITPYPW